MKELIQWLKKIGLFIFGIFLVIWGYRANAANNEKVKENIPKDKKEKSNLFGTIEVNNEDSSGTKVNTEGQKTVIESANQAEEASGTQ